MSVTARSWTGIEKHPSELACELICGARWYWLLPCYFRQRRPILIVIIAFPGSGNWRLRRKAINEIWNQVCKHADVKGRTPHSARHAMGKHIMEKTGNVAAIQRQLCYKNPAYSMQYSLITSYELKCVLDDSIDEKKTTNPRHITCFCSRAVML